MGVFYHCCEEQCHCWSEGYQSIAENRQDSHDPSLVLLFQNYPMNFEQLECE